MSNLNNWFDRVRISWLGLALLSSAGSAVAALGQAPTPLPAASAATAARMAAISPVVRSSVYTLHEFRHENGTLIQEYASLAGVVFAVSWRGPVLPDLSVLLGGYFSTFKHEIEQARSRGRRGAPVNIERDDLVVSSNGRMRNFFGHAYAPALVPYGVDIKDVLQ